MAYKVSLTFFLIFINAIYLVRSAPTAALDSATLLQNGQAAQALNSQFASLDISDACTSGQVACIGKDLAQCTTNGTWQTKACPNDKQCFALPSVRQNGTVLSCTSEADALSTIAATGAQGGIVSSQNGTSNANSTSTPVSSSTSTSASNSTSTSTSNFNSTQNANDDDGVSTVTVTITLNPSSTLSLSPETRTLAPAAASSLLAGFSPNSVPFSGAGFAASSNTPCTSSWTTIVTASIQSVAADASPPAAAAPTTIILTPSTPSPTSVVQDIAAGAPTTIILTSSPSASAVAVAPPGNGYY